MMRKGVGIGRLQHGRAMNQAAARMGTEKKAETMGKLKDGMAVFKVNLEDFAKKHKAEINKNPEFRAKFQKMCASVGVDPLASNKGFWADLLGFGDFYYELGIQVIDVTYSTRRTNGGLLDLNDLRRALESLRGRRSSAISNDDVERAVKHLRILGSGFAVVQVGHRRLVQSVPLELNLDHTKVLEMAQVNGYVTRSLLKTAGWSSERIDSAITYLMEQGQAWVDDQASERQYWLCAYF